MTRASSASASSNAFCGSPLPFSLFSLFFDRSIDVRQEAQRRVSRETRLEEEETRKRRAEKADEEENRLTVVNREKNKTCARALCSKFPAINTWVFFSRFSSITGCSSSSSFPLSKISHQPLLDLPVQPAQVLDVRGPSGAPVLGQEAGEGAGSEEGRRLLIVLVLQQRLLLRSGRGRGRSGRSRAHGEPCAAAPSELLLGEEGGRGSRGNREGKFRVRKKTERERARRKRRIERKERNERKKRKKTRKENEKTKGTTTDLVDHLPQRARRRRPGHPDDEPAPAAAE